MKKQFSLVVVALFLLFAVTSCARKFMVVDTPVLQPPARVLEDRPDVALVLGGGAFHGMAHVGVIKVLEDAGIPIDLIVGTSAGSMVGALYADNPKIDSLIPLIKSTTAKDVFDFSLFRSKEGFVSGKKLQSYLSKQLHVTQIEDTKIPFIAVTTDLEKGESVALKAGPIAPSVNASCAIPGIFEPVKMYGTTFVDGGVIDNLPVNIAKEYNPKYIIEVKIMAFNTTDDLKNRQDVIIRAYTVASNKANVEIGSQANILIAPDLKGIPLMSGKDNEKLYKLGVDAAKKMLPQIIAELQEKGVLK